MPQHDTESHRGETWRGNDEGSEIERRIATFLDNDTVSAQVKEAFSSQVLLGWEDAFQGRFSIKWSDISTPEHEVDPRIPQGNDELEQSMLI